MTSAIRAFRLPALALALLALQGCATITREECRADDWASIGQRDGAEGHPPSRLERHARTCANFDIVPDPEAYRTGWETGVLLYCTPQNGLAIGRENGPYHGLCPASVAAAFLEGRRVGSTLGAAERRVASAESRLRNIESERERLVRRREEVREDPDLSIDERRDRLGRIRDRISDLRWERDEARFDLERARAALPAAQEAAQAFFETHAEAQP